MCVNRGILTGACLLTLLLLGAGTKPPDTRPAPTAEKAPMTLTIKDDGRDVAVSVGDVIKVELEFQGGTGYSWYVDGLDETRLTALGVITVDTADKGVVGGPVQGVWSFKAAAPGDTVLRMLYYRVWEKNKSALKSFTVKFHITATRPSGPPSQP
jgi:predicted secreted protein